MSKIKEKKGAKRPSGYPLVNVDRLTRSMINMHCSQSDDEDFKPVKKQRRSTPAFPTVPTPKRFLTNKPLPGPMKRNESIVYYMTPLEAGTGNTRVQQLINKYAHPRVEKVTQQNEVEPENVSNNENSFHFRMEENLPPPGRQHGKVDEPKPSSVKQLLAANKTLTFEDELDTAFVEFNESIKRIYGRRNMANQATRGIMLLRSELKKKMC